MRAMSAQYVVCLTKVTNTPKPELHNCRPTSRQVLFAHMCCSL